MGMASTTSFEILATGLLLTLHIKAIIYKSHPKSDMTSASCDCEFLKVVRRLLL